MLPSQKVQEFRGRKVNQPLKVDHMWDLRINGDEFRYEINVEHPTVQVVHDRNSPRTSAEQFELVLEDIESTFPVIDAHNRMSGDTVPATRSRRTRSSSSGRWQSWTLMHANGVDRETFIMELGRRPSRTAWSQTSNGSCGRRWPNDRASRMLLAVWRAFRLSFSRR